MPNGRVKVLAPAEKEIEMNTHPRKIIVILLALATAPSVWAGHNNDSYSEPAYDNAMVDYAKVIDVQPITETIQIPEERQVCTERPVQRRVAESRSAGPAILGAIVGGVIGNQLSRGHRNKHGHGRGHGQRNRNNDGRAFATMTGAAIGSSIASGVQYSKYPPRYYTDHAQVCGTETTWRSEERVVAWDVSWKYRGQVYHSRMNQAPGDRIPVRVSVNPVNP